MFVMVFQRSRLMEALPSSTHNFQRVPKYRQLPAKEIRETQENGVRGFSGPGWHLASIT